MRSKFDLRDEKWHCIHNGILYDGPYMFYIPQTKTGTVVCVHKIVTCTMKVRFTIINTNFGVTFGAGAIKSFTLKEII